MRILLVSDYGTLSGGAEVMTLALRDGLRRRGHDARLFTSRARPNAGPIIADATCFGTTTRWRTLLQTANPWAYLALRRTLAEFRPDVVHVVMFLTQLSPLILPLLRAFPAVYQAVWYRAVCPLGTKLRPDGTVCKVRYGAVCRRAGCLPWRDWLPLMLQMRLLAHWAGVIDLTVPVSATVGQRLRQDGWPAAAPLRYGVAPGPMRPPLADPPLIACAARLVVEKGVDVLLRAFALLAPHHPQARLVIAGDGPQRAALTALADALGIGARVTWLGHVTREEVERQFRPAWVQVAPSRWPEPLGNVALEAMMRGTAVIATRGGGWTEVVQDGVTGRLVPPGDARALAEALSFIVSQCEEAERLGRAGRERALAQHTESEYINGWLAIYSALIQARKDAPRDAYSHSDPG